MYMVCGVGWVGCDGWGVRGRVWSVYDVWCGVCGVCACGVGCILCVACEVYGVGCS